MYEYKLTKIVFNDGTTIEPGKLTVIVGPNNAGKSRALKEIAAITSDPPPPSTPNIIVKSVDWAKPNSMGELREAYDVDRHRDANGNWSFRTLHPTLAGEFSMSGGYDWPMGYEPIIRDNPREFAIHLAKAIVVFLTTESRLQLVKESPSAGQERETANLLQALFNSGKETEKEIRSLVKSTFGREIALDFVTLQRLSLRVGDDFSSLPADPRDARPFMLSQEKLDDQGDGIRSFVGIAVALMSLKRALYLIDEPEAFLHPPQAFKIGGFLAGQVKNRRQIILATHSTDVLRGILSKTQDVSVLRIDRSSNSNRFMLLDAGRLKEIVNDPLLSSARVLDGLFYSGAVVVEADADARFYHSVSNKISPGADLHFVNADNKQTIPRITSLYRDMGVRCAGVVDFDALNDQTEFHQQLDALALPEEEKQKALTIQGEIATAAKEIPPDERLANVKARMNELLTAVAEMEGHAFASDTQAISSKRRLLRRIESRARELADSTKNWKQFKEQGRSALAPELQVEFDKLAQICAGKGLFINPCGELESMLTEHGIPYTTDKKAWIRTALQLLASLTVDFEKYPWKFVKGIHDQILDKGGSQNKDDGAEKSTELGNGMAAAPAHRLEDRAGETAGKDNPKIKGHGFDWRSGGQIDGSGFGDSPGRVLLTIYRGLREHPTGGGGLLKIWRMPMLDIGGDSIKAWTDDHIEFTVTIDFLERIERFKSETDRRAAENHFAQQDSLELGCRYMVVTTNHHSAESVPSMPHVPVETVEV